MKVKSDIYFYILFSRYLFNIKIQIRDLTNYNISIALDSYQYDSTIQFVSPYRINNHIFASNKKQQIPC